MGRSFLPQTVRGKIRLLCLIPLLLLMALSGRYVYAKFLYIKRIDRLAERLELHAQAMELNHARTPFLITRELARRAKKPAPEQPELMDRIAAFQEQCRSRNLSGNLINRRGNLYDYPRLSLHEGPLTVLRLRGSKNERLRKTDATLLGRTGANSLYLERELASLLHSRIQLDRLDFANEFSRLKQQFDEDIELLRRFIQLQNPSRFAALSKAENNQRPFKEPLHTPLKILENLSRELEKETEKRLARMRRIHELKLGVAIGLLLITPLLIWLLLRRLDHAIMTPLATLQKKAAQIGSGERIEPQLFAEPSEFSDIEKALQKTQQNIDTLRSELERLADSVRAGRLDMRGDPSEFQGDWSKLVVGMNDTLAEAERLKLRADEEAEERSKTERMLYQSQKQELIGRMAGGLAHDFNNYLTIIRGSSELMLDETENERESDSLKDVLNAACNASDLVRRLSMVAQTHTLNPESLALRSTLLQTEKLIRLGIKDHVELSINEPPAHARIHMDPSAFEQVLLNLTFNAGHAMPEGGKLNIDTAPVLVDQDRAVRLAVEPGPYWRIDVSDSGVGIPENIQELVFEAFFSTRPGNEGSGLGLSMVRALVQQSGGWVHLDSTVGVGTVISLFIPATERVPEGERSLPANFTRGNGTILLVEDRAPVRKFTRKILTRFGYHVIEATNGDHGVLQYKANEKSIQLILSDVLMPNLNGPDMVRRIRKHTNRQCPVIFVSGYNDVQLEEGFDEDLPDCSFMSKPFDLNQLSIKISEEIQTSPN